MENTSGISEKTPSSTPSIDERDLVMSMRKLDLIKELGYVLIYIILKYFVFLVQRKTKSISTSSKSFTTKY